MGEEIKDTKNKLNNLKKETGEIVKGRDDLIDSIVLALASNEHILIIGPPGEGKSMCAELITKSTGLKYFSQQLHQETRIRDIVGIFNPLAFSKPEMFVQKEDFNGSSEKMTELYEHLLMKSDIWDANVIFFDEIMRARSEFVDFMLEIMQERRISKTILPTKDVPVVSIIATTNPLDEQYNTERLDMAIKDRFFSIIDMNPLIEEDEPATREVIDQKENSFENVLENVDISTEELKEFKEQAKEEVDYQTEIIFWIFKKMKEEGFSFSARFQKKFRKVLQVNALLNDREEVEADDLFDVSYTMLPNRFKGLDEDTIRDVVDSAVVNVEYAPLIEELNELSEVGKDMEFIQKGLTLINKADQQYPEMPSKIQEELNEQENKVKEKIRENFDKVEPLLIEKLDSEKFADVRKEFIEKFTVRTEMLSERDRENVRDIINRFKKTCKVEKKEDSETGSTRYIIKPKLDNPKSFKEAETLGNKLEDYLQMF